MAFAQLTFRASLLVGATWLKAVSAPERLGDLAVRIFGPQYGVEVELPQRGAHEPMDFSA